ncbi:MAG: quinolinate synthase NadA [Mycobacterium leprae]
MRVESELRLVEEIREWKARRNAVILAHNYEIGPVQDIADFVGDSLALARAATRTQADMIALCGVHFMAETAAILNPGKSVVLPDLEAGCSMADSITADQLRAWKAEHPGAVVVAYVNTTAAVKAESDYCCTSANAVQVVNAIPADQEILFLPDMFLGNYVREETGRQNMQIWMGECHVHAGIHAHDLHAKRAAHPGAELLIHPECGCSTSAMYLLATGELPAENTHLLSTGGMLRHVRESAAREFIVATEVGIIHGLQRENPGKRFMAANPDAVCPFMKKINLENLLHSLQYPEEHTITVPAEMAQLALRPIERMISIG